MSLDRVVDLLAARLSAALGAGTRVDDVAPDASADLPCAVLSLAAVTGTLGGIGRLPDGTRAGALKVTAAVDLADPVLDLGGGETLTLLSPDRLTLTLPHGPLVAADGTQTAPLGPGDVSANDGAAFAVVSADPAGRQVRADAVAGTMRFGVPLAGAGTLTVTYHVGRWDVATVRAQGRLAVDVTAATTAAVRTTSRGLSAAASSGLSDAAVTVRLAPVGWGPVTSVEVAGSAVRTQRLTFVLDAEFVEPVLTTSGGVITTVSVRGFFAPLHPGDVPDQIEPFDVTRGEAT